jgi:hypothetical protein
MWKLKVYALADWGGWCLVEERTYQREALAAKRRIELYDFYVLQGWQSTTAYYGRVA